MDKDTPFQIWNKDLIFLEAVQDSIAEEVLEDLDKAAKDLLRNGKKHLKSTLIISKNKLKRKKKRLRSLNQKLNPKLKSLKFSKKNLSLTLRIKNSLSLKQQHTYQKL